MPQFERRLYEPSEDARAFDSDEDMEDEGSRLPLLIGIALIVLLSFAGVVWLAYTQGVERGRADPPRVVASADVASKPTPYSKLKIYQSPKTDEDVASEDNAPPPAVVAPPDLGASKPTAPAAKPNPTSSDLKPTTEAPKSESASPKANAAEPAVQPATGAPRVITPTPATVKPTKPAVSPAKTPAAKARTPPAVAPKPNALKTAPQAKTTIADSTAKQSSAASVKPTIAKPVHAKTVVAKTAPATPAGVKPAPIVLIPPKPAARGAAISPATTTPTAAATAAAPKETSAKSGAGGFVLQIGSYKSDAEANASWQTYKGAHSSVASYSSDVRKVLLGAKGTWYRLRIGPFASLGEANAACAKLKAQGGNCFPAKQ